MKLICAQYEIRDLLRWKLGLRSPETLDITKLGIKSIDLSKNFFGDYFCEQLSLALKADEYMKCLIIKKNKIGVTGLKFLAEAVFQHPGLLSLDVRHNAGYNSMDTIKYKKIMKNAFLANIKHDMFSFETSGNRINTEFIVPDCIGLSKNHLDEPLSAYNPEQRRAYFVELMVFLCDDLNMKWSHILRAVMGSDVPCKKDQFRKQLEHLRVQMRNKNRPKSKMS